jgi:hypothetical protein
LIFSDFTFGESQHIGDSIMRILYPGEFNKVAGGRGIKKAFEKAKHQVSCKAKELEVKVQREFDRKVKHSLERMGGDTSNLDMDKAREIDQQKIQHACQDQEVQQE